MSVRSLATRAARAFQACTRGPRTSLSPANRTTPGMATTARSCWRFLVSTHASFIPHKIKAELQRRRLPARRTEIDLGDLRNATQLLERLKQRLVRAGRAGAGDGAKVADFDCFGSDRAVLRKLLADAAQNGQAADGLIEPGSVLP